MVNLDEEWIIILTILTCVGIMGGVAWYRARVAPAKLARLRTKPEIAIESVSSPRQLVVFAAASLVYVTISYAMLTAWPADSGHGLVVFLTVICLGFLFVLVPLTIGRRFTVAARLALDASKLSLQVNKATSVVSLERPFVVLSASWGGDRIVVITQDRARLFFACREGPQFVTVPYSHPADEFLREGETPLMFPGVEAVIIYQRLMASPQKVIS